MAPLSLVTFAAAVLCYVAATALFYWDIVRGREGSARLAPLLLGVGAGSHAVYVTIASFVARVCPVHSVHFVLSTASLLTTAVYLMARRRFRIQALGLLVAPLGLVLALGTFFLGSNASEQPLPASFIGFHVLAVLVGFAMFLLAFGSAVLYLVQEKRLKSKKLPLDDKLPALDTLDRSVHRFLLAGFPLLTLGVVTGTARGVDPAATQELLRAVLGYATWLSFGGVLLLRVVAGWRGRRSAYGTVAGFVCAVIVLLFYIVRPILGASPILGGS